MTENIFKFKNIGIFMLIGVVIAFFAMFFAYVGKTSEVVITKGDYSHYFPNTSTVVVFYGNSTCHYCKSARAFLKRHGVLYADYNIDQSKDGAKQFAELKGDAVPLILIGNEKIVGFHEVELRGMLARNNLMKNQN